MTDVNRPRKAISAVFHSILGGSRHRPSLYGFGLTRSESRAFPPVRYRRGIISRLMADCHQLPGIPPRCSSSAPSRISQGLVKQEGLHTERGFRRQPRIRRTPKPPRKSRLLARGLQSIPPPPPKSDREQEKTPAAMARIRSRLGRSNREPSL